MIGAGCGRLGFGGGATDGPCEPGAACTSVAPCRIGVCSSDGLCLAAEPLADGARCSAGTCGAGVCEGSSSQTLSDPMLVANAGLGLAVDLDGDVGALGAWRQTVAGLALAGSVVMVERDAGGVWQVVERVEARAPQASEVFGCSVALDGDRLLVGARWHDVGGMGDAGGVYAFERQPGQSWEQAQLIELADSFELGSSVTLEGTRALLGAEYDTASGVGWGAAHVAEWDGGSWQVVARLDSPRGDRTGHAVALAGERAVVGSLWDLNPDGVETGAVHVFEHQGGASWPEVATLYPAAPERGSAAGSTVAIAGETIVAGSHLRTVPDGSTSGTALVFDRDAGNWLETEELMESGFGTSGEYARSVAFADGRLLVSGVDWETEEGVLSVYREQADGSWVLVARFTDAGLANGSGVGLGGHVVDAQVAVSGDAAAVGYPLLDSSGAVVFYDLAGL